MLDRIRETNPAAVTVISCHDFESVMHTASIRFKANKLVLQTADALLIKQIPLGASSPPTSANFL